MLPSPAMPQEIMNASTENSSMSWLRQDQTAKKHHPATLPGHCKRWEHCGGISSPVHSKEESSDMTTSSSWLHRPWAGFSAVQNTSLASKYLFTDAFGVCICRKLFTCWFCTSAAFIFPAANLTACSLHWHKTFSRWLSQLAFHLKIHGNITSHTNHETTAFYDHQPFRHSPLLCSTT